MSHLHDFVYIQCFNPDQPIITIINDPCKQSCRSSEWAAQHDRGQVATSSVYAIWPLPSILLATIRPLSQGIYSNDHPLNEAIYLWEAFSLPICRVSSVRSNKCVNEGRDWLFSSNINHGPSILLQKCLTIWTILDRFRKRWLTLLVTAYIQSSVTLIIMVKIVANNKGKL